MQGESGCHALAYDSVLLRLRTNQSGLCKREAERRLREVGLNQLVEKPRPSLFVRFLGQLGDLMTQVLLAATAVSALMGEYADAVIIVAIVVLNSTLGLIQEWRAEKALAALKKLASPTVTARRDGTEETIAVSQLVPGDIVLLTAGDRIPADVRLGQAWSFEVDEAALTGESVPVSKHTHAVAEGAGVPERTSMAYFGTMATKGRAEGVVVATGMATEVGLIARLLQTKDEPTPLQQRFAELSRYLVAACIAVCVGVVVLGLSHGEPLYSMFLAGVSLAVAAIPEGLPAIVTIVLALGVQRIAKVKALVRRLPAVETLGSATVICSDKTGTLTCNQMTVTEVWAGGEVFRVTGYGLNPQGEFYLGAKRVDATESPDLSLALRIGAVCTATRVTRGKQVAVLGDPTEAALIVAAEKAKLETTVSLVKELPFDSQRMLMSVVIRNAGGRHLVFTKGAPDALFAVCTEYREQGRSHKLTPAALVMLQKKNEELAARGLRVLGVAYREYRGGQEQVEAASIERGLTLVGLVGMYDPPRPEVKATLRKCKMAGIRVIMVTGDHALTALAIAREIELVGKEARAVTGKELSAMHDGELEKIVSEVNVFARVSPECKLRLVRALRRLGAVVAMTGDGINDAPALKEADIGVSMGQCGTEVAREASALVLQDDNFATIVKAIEEGRGIYDNIRKFVRYLLSCNVGELLAVFVAMAVGLPLPLRPMQILWVNLVTDGLPAMALGVDSADKNVMLRQPRSPQEGVFSRGLARRILTRGVLIGLSTALVFAASLTTRQCLATAQTMAFATLVVCQLLHVFDCRSETLGVAEKGLTTNPLLLGAVVSSALLLLVSIYWPFLRDLFGNVPLGGADWGIVLLASGLPTLVIGVRRLLTHWVA